MPALDKVLHMGAAIVLGSVPGGKGKSNKVELPINMKNAEIQQLTGKANSRSVVDLFENGKAKASVSTDELRKAFREIEISQAARLNYDTPVSKELNKKVILARKEQGIPPTPAELKRYNIGHTDDFIIEFKEGVQAEVILTRPAIEPVPPLKLHYADKPYENLAAVRADWQNYKEYVRIKYGIQNKHIVSGNNDYLQNLKTRKSILEADPVELLEQYKYIVPELDGDTLMAQKIDTGHFMGWYNKGDKLYPSTKISIIYDTKGGAHIIVAP